MTSPKNEPKERIEEIKNILRSELPPGTRIFTVLNHVTRSGMTRSIGAHHFTISEMDGQPLSHWLSWRIAAVCGFGWDEKREAVKVGGCGMDMGFHLIYTLGRVLYPDGFKLASHQNGRNGDTSRFDNDGGYAFQQCWL